MSDTEPQEDVIVPPEKPSGFEFRLDGEVIHTVDIDPRLVTGVRMYSAAGEVGVAGVPFSGEGSNWISLTMDVQQPTSLPVVEDDARLAAQETGPKEVATFNPIAQRAEEEMVTNPDGSQDVPATTEAPLSLDA